MKRFLIALGLFVIACGVSAAEITREVRQWEVVEFGYTAAATPPDPFSVEFGAVITSAGGDALRVPGFFDGGKTWRLRFCPPTTGRWSLVTYSSHAELAGHVASLTVLSNEGPAVRGPIGISETRRQRFVYADGSPYFCLAFELDWLFALDAENGADIPKTRRIIDAVAANGFNQIVMNVFAYDAGWGEKDKIRPENNYARPRVFPFGGDNEAPDHATLNVTYFQRFDRVLRLLNERGIVAHLMIYVWNKKVNWPDAESAADNRYFDYVVKRYQAFPNLIWDISKEALGYGHTDMGYVTRRIDRLRRLDGHGRLLTVHDYNYCSAYPDKVDFISIQEWQPYLYPRMVDVAKEHPLKPVFNIEHGGYEKTTHSIFDGAYTNPLTCLDRAYQCVFAGTYPTYYWQNAAWYNVISDPFALPAEQQPHFRYYRHMAELFTEFPLLRLRAHDVGFSTPILSDDDGNHLFYLTDNRTGIYGSLPGGKGKKYRVRWFDPLTGRSHDGGTKEYAADHWEAWLGMKRHRDISGPLAIAIFSEIK